MNKTKVSRRKKKAGKRQRQEVKVKRELQGYNLQNKTMTNL